MDTLSAMIRSWYASFVPSKEQQLAAAKRLQGAAFDARPDANHPLQLWAKRVSDSLVGPDATANTVDVPGTRTDKWQIYVPVVLLGLAVFLIFND